MVELHDKEKTAALRKEAREITAGLQSEIGSIATQMSRVLDDREEVSDDIGPPSSDPLERERRTSAAMVSRQPAGGKSFWRVWR